MKPFFKWAGGKYRLLGELKKHFPAGNRFVEPFLGGGAISLNIDYPEYWCNDANEDLIDFWIALQKGKEEFIEDCAVLFAPNYNTPEMYYHIREGFNLGEMTEECFLYLNRHGFNGLCRYNKSGKFNVPFGKYNKPYFPRKEMEYAFPILDKMELTCLDFREVINHVGKGDIVYCDPPYVPLSNTSNFTSYSSDGFTMKDQKDLSICAMDAAARGAIIFISNHDTPEVRKLYLSASIHEVEVQRNISCKGDKREKVKEIIAVF